MSVDLGTDAGVPKSDSEAAPNDIEESIRKDDLFHLLQSSRRRFVLAYLQELNQEVSLGELADQVAAWEHNTTTDKLLSNDRRKVYISLYQVHLDSLEEYGIINFDKDRVFVTRTEKASQLDPYVDTPNGNYHELQAETQSRELLIQRSLVICGIVLFLLSIGHIAL
ncbi:hypothetical protein DMJ13_19110 [halophilic archaeon]|nr:hypothetical protein DMJ13_19110 [halophilic archaeon]